MKQKMNSSSFKKALFFLFLLIFLFIGFQVNSEEPLKMADTYLKTKNYLKAKEIYYRYKEDPKLAPDALIGLGKAEYFLGNYTESSIYLKRLLRDFKDSPHVNEGNLYMGLAMLKQGKIKDAESFLNKVHSPFEKQAMVGKAWIAFHKGNLKFVEQVLNKLDKKDLYEPDVALLKVKYLTASGKPVEALKEFEKNYALKKPDYDIDKAEILMKAGKYQEAETALKKFIERAKKNLDIVKAKNLLFDLYFQQGRFEEAAKVGKELYFYIPNDEFKIKLYNVYFSQKNYDEALRMLIGLRDKKLKQEKIEEFLKKLMDENPEKAEDYILKSYFYLPSESSLLLESANFLVSKEKLSEAKNLLRKLQTGKRRADANIPLAKILLKENKVGEAKKLLEPMIDKNQEAAILYALALEKEGNKQSALQYLRKNEKNIKDAEIIAKLGDLEYSYGDKKKAFVYWNRAAQLGNAEAMVKTADYLYLSNKTKEAADYYKKAIDAGVKDTETLMWVYYQYGKITKDKKYLEKVAESNSQFKEAAKALLEKL